MSSPVASQDADTPETEAIEHAIVAPRTAATFWVVGGRIAGILATGLVAFLLPHALSPAECGQFLLLQNLIGLAALLAAGGLPLAVVKLLSEGLALRDYARMKSALVGILGIGLTASLLVATATAGLLFFWKPEAVQLAGNQAWLFLFCGTLTLIAWQWVLVEAIRGLGELRWASLFAGGQSGGPVATLIFVAGLLVFGAGGHVSATMALAIFAGTLAATLPVVICCLGLAWKAVAWPLRVAKVSTSQTVSLVAILGLALPICTSQILAYLSLSADIPIAGLFCEQEEVALLGQTRRLMLVLQLPTQMLVMTILPAVARLYAEGSLSTLQHLVRKSTNFSALFTFAAAVAMLVAPGLVLSLLFGEFYRQGAPLLVALALGQLVAAHNGMAGYILLMAGRQQTVVMLNAITAGLMISVGPLAANAGGILGLTIASSAILALQSTLEWWAARRLLGVSSHVDWDAALRIFAKIPVSSR